MVNEERGKVERLGDLARGSYNFGAAAGEILAQRAWERFGAGMKFLGEK